MKLFYHPRHVSADLRSGSSMGAFRATPKTKIGLFALPKVDRSEFSIVYFSSKMNFGPFPNVNYQTFIDIYSQTW